VKGLVAAGVSLAPFLLASFGLLVLAVAVTLFVGSEGFGYDFRAYDAAARRVATGASPYLPGTAEAYRDGQYEGLYLYPPQLAIALVPLTVLSQTAATLAWMGLRIGLLIAGCLILPVSRQARFAVLGVACLSFPVMFDLNIGNVSIAAFALLAAAWRWPGTPAAAVLHAVLATVRFPFLLFGVLWLTQRRLRYIAWTIVAGLVLLVAAVPVVGINAYADYVGILRGLPGIAAGPHNLSLATLATGLSLSEPVPSIALVAGYVAGLGVVVYTARNRDDATAFVVTALATLLVAPFIHPHYLVLLLLPAALLADRGHWWAVGLPLLGWLPDPVLPLAAPLTVGLVLMATSRTTASIGRPAEA
jgi:hypothetical protein